MTWVVRGARVLLGIYSVLLLLALFSPTSDQQSGAVQWLGSQLTSAGLPEQLVAFNRLEVLMNAAIVAPVTFLASLVWPAWTWRDWTAAGFVFAVGVELAQGLLLPGRQAAFSDVVANTTGAMAGALVVSAARSMLRAPTSR
jgi:glycopeptide antibiotics resistance protein